MLSRRFFQTKNHFILSFRRGYQKDVAIIGYPFGGGQTKKSAENTPRVFRENGIIEKIEGCGRKVVDYGDIHVPEYSCEFPSLTHFDENKVVKNAKESGIASELLAALVEKAARDDKVCVTIGGDHSLATGSILGHLRAREKTCVIWVDAQFSINSPSSTRSGNIHGMPLSPVIKELPDFTCVPGYEWTTPMLSPRDLVYIGLRESDPEEYEIAERLGLAYFSMHDVDRYGISNVIERAIEMVNPKMNKPMHVSFGIDSLELDVCPGTGKPVSGGFTLREALFIGETINKTGLLAALDIAEVNPYLCNSIRDWEVTMDTAFQIVQSFLGKHRPGYEAVVPSGF